MKKKKHYAYILWGKDIYNELRDKNCKFTVTEIKQFIKENDSTICNFTKVEFETKAELLAYRQGIEDADGWMKHTITKSSILDFIDI